MNTVCCEEILLCDPMQCTVCSSSGPKYCDNVLLNQVKKSLNVMTEFRSQIDFYQDQFNKNKLKLNQSSKHYQNEQLKNNKSKEEKTHKQKSKLMYNYLKKLNQDYIISFLDGKKENMQCILNKDQNTMIKNINQSKDYKKDEKYSCEKLLEKNLQFEKKNFEKLQNQVNQNRIEQKDQIENNNKSIQFSKINNKDNYNININNNKNDYSNIQETTKIDDKAERIFDKQIKKYNVETFNNNENNNLSYNEKQLSNTQSIKNNNIYDEDNNLLQKPSDYKQIIQKQIKNNKHINITRFDQSLNIIDHLDKDYLNKSGMNDIDLSCDLESKITEILKSNLNGMTSGQIFQCISNENKYTNLTLQEIINKLGQVKGKWIMSENDRLWKLI